MQRLAKPITDLKDSYEAVVVGSGYGGAIAASRLARMDIGSVALLERGEELHPGEYPDTAIKGAEQFQVSAPGLHRGRGTELFDLHVGKGISVLTGCGLGGTSLINANVSLRADPRVFDDPAWPRALKDGDLEEGYARAEAMLRPRPYPDDGITWPHLNKLEAMKKAAPALGAAAVTPPINVNFEAGTNRAGVEQPACNLCGDCCSGCNTGAKNTTLMNYLPDAVAHGAEIFCGVRVRWIEKLEDGRWCIAYDPIGLGREAFTGEPLRLTASIVVLGAGTLGSTEILLRSRDHGLALSPALGSRFSGNGDVLGFGYNNDQAIDGIGLGHRAAAYRWPRDKDEQRPIGPTITGLIDLRGTADLEEGMVIEEGAIPGAIAASMPAVMAATAAALGTDTDPGDVLSERAREVESLTRGPYHGAVNHTQTFLVMSHDGPGAGTMELDADDRLRVVWPGVGEQAGFKRVAENLRTAVRETGGSYVPNPIWTKLMNDALISVHPLGGCPMADDAAHGVVDGDCRVFAGHEGSGVHPGLYVCDGSVMPRSLGVNPLLTISAVTERAMIKLAAARGAPLEVESVVAKSQPAVGAPTIGVRFTERMTGKATAAVGGAQSEASFVVTIVAADLDALVKTREHEAGVVGTVSIPALSSEPMTIEDGRWNLFVDDTAKADTKLMVYELPIVASDGSRYHFSGRKTVHNDRGFDLWHDTTTLTASVHQGDRNGATLFTAELHIRPADFIHQLGTMTITGAPDLESRAMALARFGEFFGGALFTTFGGPFARPSYFDPEVPRTRRPLRVGPPEVHFFETSDGKKLRLTRYRGGDKGPVMASHGLGVSSLIFSIDTIDTSLLEYLYAGGYDVWLLDYRASIELPYAREQFSADDVADKDYPAAIATILTISGKPSLQVVAHCYGAMSFSMAMLRGLKGVRSIVISQIAAHADVPFFTQRLLAFLRATDLMKLVGVKLLDARATRKRNLLARAIDGFLRFLYPLHFDDRTRSVTSLRIAALYGPLYRLDQLNEPTLQAMPEMFGKSNLSAFSQLAEIARSGHVVRSDKEPLLAPENLRNWAVPTLFIHGELNRAFLPSGTLKTMNALSEANSPDLYERVVIPATGHIDCIFGKNAVRTVYPSIVAHLDKTAMI
ncbi:MAG TPA: alpha/beta fold hydrolase [Sphingomicrobium sp.]|nr:alpha/beta fold hydrolase [Sphingomicrobium sp.]